MSATEVANLVDVISCVGWGLAAVCYMAAWLATGKIIKTSDASTDWCGVFLGGMCWPITLPYYLVR